MTSLDTRTARVENYLGSVGEHLAVRGTQPERVGEHLEELAGHLSASGNEPVDEFGPPEALARDLSEADRLGWSNRLSRLVGLTLGLAGWATAFALLLGGNGPATLSASQVGSLFVPMTIGAFALSPIGARFRDQLFGVTPSPPGAIRTSLVWLVGLTIAAVGCSIAVEFLVDDRVVGSQSIRSWVAGLVLVGALLPVTAWAHHNSTGRARFPTGSPLRSSNMTRQIRLGSTPNSPFARALALLTPLIPMIVVLAMILAAGRLAEPFDVLVLVAALAVGAAWVYLLGRR